MGGGPKLGIGHVFVIVLENESSESTYLHNPHPYLGKVLQRQGTLLTNYYATGHVSLDNYIAMISGQAPNAQTSSDCQTFFESPTGAEIGGRPKLLPSAVNPSDARKSVTLARQANGCGR